MSSSALPSAAVRGATSATVLDAAALLPLLLEETGEAFLTLDADWRVTTANAAAARLLGRPADSLLGVPVWSAYPAALGRTFHRACERVCATGRTETVEAYYEPRERWYRARVTPFADGVAFVFDDVTESRRLAARFAAVTAASGTAAWIADADGAATESTPSWLAFTGMAPDEAIGHGWAAAVHPDDRARVAAEWRAAAAASVPFRTEHRFRRHDGAWRHVEVRAYPVRDGAGRIGEWIGLNTDVTELREAERARAASEARYRRLFDAHPLPMLLLEAGSMVVLDGNAAALACYGWAREAFGTFTLLDVRDPGAPAVRSDGAELPPHTGDAHHVRTRHRTATGHVFEAEVHSAPLDLLGADVRLLTVVDVSERVRAAEALRRSEERLRVTLDATGDGIYDWRTDTDEVYRSDGYVRMLGYGRDDMDADKTAWIDRVHPDDRADVEALLAEHLDGRLPVYAAEYRLRRADGTWTWILDRGKVVERDAHGAPRRMVGVFTDVGARKAAEASLLDRTMQLELGMRAAGLGTWRWDAASPVAEHSASYARLFGYDPGSRTHTFDDFVARVHPDDLPAMRRAIAELHAGTRHELASEYRVCRTDGTEVVVLERGVAVRDVNGRLVRILGVCRDVTAERAHEAALQGALAAREASEARLRLTLEASRMGTWEFVPATGAVTWSDTVAPLFGLPRGWQPADEAQLLDLVHEDDRDRLRTSSLSALDHDGTVSAEYRVVLADGSVRHLQSRGAAQVGRDDARIVGVVSDVTERVQLETQLRQAQKMEAVGQLAGGVAHDFNNLLTIIGGNLGFVRADLPPDHPAQSDLGEIAQASERARGLVRQLLAFSRRQALAPQRVALDDVVRGAERLLRRVIGEEIVLDTALAADGGIVLADAGQLDQVLMNLAVNARDAMLTPAHGHPGTGGMLTLETAHVTLAPHDARALADWAPLAAGRYVRLTVRDTGHGMDAATRAHALEPFFTTKPVGAGTGLGLATVYGIVVQSGGAVRLDSAPGRGTAVTVLLPAVEGEAATPASASSRSAAPAAGQGVVLLVEDETPVRATARRILERHGYSVLEARHGADALMLWRRYRDDVVAVVSDVRMPEMSGRELAAALREDRPTLPLVLVSGYVDQPMTDAFGEGVAFVEKPFTGAALLGALARVLAARAA